MGRSRTNSRFRPAFIVIVIVFVLTGCGRKHSPITDEVKVEVANVDLDHETGIPFVLLKEVSGQRVLQMIIGEPEAQSLLLQLRKIDPPRPLTHDLLRSLVETTGNKVDRVVVTDLRDKTYFATIYLDRGKYQIDSRPSDALGLALRAHAPIYVAARLLNNADQGITAGESGNGPEATRALGLTLQDVTPEIAAYFNVAPGQGIIVSDVELDAAKAGAKRGDILVKVGGKPVANLGDFAKRLTQLNGDSVKVTVKRGAEEKQLTLPLEKHDNG